MIKSLRLFFGKPFEQNIKHLHVRGFFTESFLCTVKVPEANQRAMLMHVVDPKVNTPKNEKTR